MSAPHTPGPWRLDGFATGWEVASASSSSIADVHMLTKGRSDEESEANAHLIAAAPDMLVLLKAIAAGEGSALELMGRTIEAIRRAEGRS